MLTYLSKKFAGKLVSIGIISETDADIYEYGFFQFTMFILNVSTTIIIALLFQLLLPCVVLNLSFIPLRINAGGHHANSPIKCYIRSTLMISSLLTIIRFIPIHPILLIVLVIISIVINLIFSPVETDNNPLDDIEIKVYRKRIKLILFIEAIVFLFSFIFMENWISKTISLGMISECYLVLIGKIQNVRKKKNT